MKRRPRIDTVLERPEISAELEEFKRLFGLAAHRYGVGDAEGHCLAALKGREVALRIVTAVRAEPGNATLPAQAIYRYVANVAHHDLLGERAKADDMILSELGVKFPPGRPPTRRPRARQQLLEELAARPEMPDWRVADRARVLGVWASDWPDDATNRQRRIRRLRAEAAQGNRNRI